jgi:hypothetical protein
LLGIVTRMATNEQLTPVFMPSLVSVLLRHEQDKGLPLTEQEVLSIRDKAVAVMIPRSATTPIFEQRGYDDIEPERCWEQWQDIRKQFDEKRDS